MVVFRAKARSTWTADIIRWQFETTGKTKLLVNSTSTTRRTYPHLNTRGSKPERNSRWPNRNSNSLQSLLYARSKSWSAKGRIWQYWPRWWPSPNELKFPFGFAICHQLAELGIGQVARRETTGNCLQGEGCDWRRRMKKLSLTDEHQTETKVKLLLHRERFVVGGNRTRFFLPQNIGFQQKCNDAELPVDLQRGLSHGGVPIKCRPLTYQKLRVVQDMSIGRPGQENQVDDNDNRLEFNVFIGDFMALVL